MWFHIECLVATNTPIQKNLNSIVAVAEMSIVNIGKVLLRRGAL